MVPGLVRSHGDQPLGRRSAVAPPCRRQPGQQPRGAGARGGATALWSGQRDGGEVDHLPTHGQRHPAGGCRPTGSSPWSAATPLSVGERGHTVRNATAADEAGRPTEGSAAGRASKGSADRSPAEQPWSAGPADDQSGRSGSARTAQQRDPPLPGRD